MNKHTKKEGWSNYFGSDRRSILKFSKGSWTLGRDNEIVSADRVFCALMPTLEVGWERWTDSGPVRKKVYWNKEFKRPDRAECGDNDKSQWPIDNRTNQRRDPWQRWDSIILVDENKVAVRFMTTTQGGRDAIEALCQAYGADDNSDLFPVVKLSGGRRETQHGFIDYPIFEIVEWADPEAFAAIIAAATSEQSEIDDEVPRIAARPLRDILDDDIPF
jgi:hypothetical protein